MYGILYRVESECLTAVEGLIYIDPALAAGVGELYILKSCICDVCLHTVFCHCLRSVLRFNFYFYLHILRYIILKIIIGCVIIIYHILRKIKTEKACIV